MYSSPFFSVIIPSFNRASFIVNTIESVVNQTYTNWELIIVDDASTDDTKEKVESIQDTRIKYIRNEINKERGFSRNKGIEVATGQYICFLDSDDAFLPNHLQSFYDFIISNDYPTGLMFSNKILKMEDGQEIEDISMQYPWRNKFSYILRYTFNPTRVCISKNVFKDYLFDTSIPGLEDIDLWLRIATKYYVKHIQKYTNIYVVHEDSYTLGDAQRFEKELKYFKTIFAKPELKNYLPYWDKSRLLSMCHYHIAVKSEIEKKYWKMYSEILKSFFLFPSGYNHRTNKILFIMFVYQIPILGDIMKRINSALKKK